MSRLLIALLGGVFLVGAATHDAEARSRKKSSKSKSASKSSSKASKKSRRGKKPKETPEEPVEAAAKPKEDAPPAANPEQAEADRHFRNGVTLYKEDKFAEALAEFERAYEIAPHPLVLYNIAGCHRELSNYAESVKYSQRFLEEGKGIVSKSRLATAQTELEAVLARIARVTVTVEGAEGSELLVDGVSIGTFPLDMPLILPPGEHRLLVRAEGYRDAERTMRLASGDELDVALTLAKLPPEQEKPAKIGIRKPDRDIDEVPRSKGRVSGRRFSIGGGYGSNLNAAKDTGAGTARLAVRLGTRFELGVEGVFVAYAVVPSLRFRLFGDAVSAHLIAAAPVALKVGDNMEETFVAGAGGLGFRFHVTDRFAVRLEGFYSYAGKEHGTTYPAFIGGELWF